MVCVPVPMSVTPDKMATPTLSDTALPLFRLTVVVPTVSVKVTEPVGTVELLVGSVTVAVMVTGARRAGLGLMDNNIEVASGWAAIPLSEMVCVA